MEKATLKALRVNCGLTLEEASQKLGISIYTLSSYENGKTYPNIPIIQKMIKLYHTEFDRINFLCK